MKAETAGRVLGMAVFPVLPLSWNAMLALGTMARARKRSQDKARWAILLMTKEGRKLPRGVKGVEVHVSCVGATRRDPDNLYSKTIIDAMRQVGILHDDDSEHVTAVRLEYRKRKGVPEVTGIRLVESTEPGAGT